MREGVVLVLQVVEVVCAVLGDGVFGQVGPHVQGDDRLPRGVVHLQVPRPLVELDAVKDGQLETGESVRNELSGGRRRSVRDK